MPSSNGHRILSYDDPAARSHNSVIGTLVDRALDLKVIDPQTERVLIGSDGIVCNDHGGPSVQKYLDRSIGEIHRADQNDNLPPAEVERTNKVRRLVCDVLATRLNMEGQEKGLPMTDDPAAAVQDTADRIEALEQHCRQYGIPSLLRTLAHGPQSLQDHLERPEYAIGPQDGRYEVHHRLVELLARSDSQLPIVLNKLLDSGQFAGALDLIDHAVHLRGGTFAQFFSRHPDIAEQYAYHSFVRGEHGGVIEAARGAGLSAIRASTVLSEKYFRSLLEVGDMEQAYALLKVLPPPKNYHLKKAIAIGCVQIGWWLHSLGRSAEAIAMLKRHVPNELKPNGHPDTRALYNALQTPDRDAARIEKLKAEVRGEKV